jgi:acetyltransferase-like isoleucine patch superfamily enzyme
MRVQELFRGLIQLAAFPLPWAMRRRILSALLGFDIDPNATIGYSLIFAQKVSLQEGASIASFNLVSPIGLLKLGPFARLGPGNRIVGRQETQDYGSEDGRTSALIMEEHSAITRKHIVDCSNTVHVGRFALIAGYHSQILTHSPDFELGIQRTEPISIGEFVFVGTNAIILPGANLAARCFLSAGSVLIRPWEEEYSLLSGNPARNVRSLNPEIAFFNREVGRLS